MTSIFGQKSLTDLVRGIRSNKKNEGQFISQSLQEIKDELKSPDHQKKTVAVQKLTYLQMLGYDLSWAAFNIIEVMSQQKYTPKRIGYLAASQSFNEKTEVITLVTNLIRKDMTSSNVWEAAVALNCLGNICTTDLARDLAADVVSLLSSSRPYTRKKACLVLYKIFLKFPDALRPAFPRLKEKLEDPDQAVVAAAVNVICELARKNPKNYIALSPILFNILTNSTNNWVLIKIVKLFGNLLPIEQRLAKKLVLPLTNLINNTPAVSLLYECIQTCTIGLAEHIPTIKLCITKLRTFVEDPDQNLKYLGLVSLGNIMKIHPKAVAEHKDLVVNCLDDDDVTIRLRALDLLEGMVNKKNIADVVRKLLDHIEKADQQHYKDSLIEKIIRICSQSSYQFITDFEWYISVLMELAHVRGTTHGELIASQLMDVMIRVQVIRPFGIKSMVSLLRDITTLSENPVKGESCEVLYSAAWVTGEFASNISDPVGVVEALLQPRAVSLPAHIQSVYMQALLKIFAQVVSGGVSSGSDLISTDSEVSKTSVSSALVDEVVSIIQQRLPLFSQSQHLEVQERACFAQVIIDLYKELKTTGVDLAGEIKSLFEEPLNPVAPKAQKKVPVPEGLDLDAWINEPEPELEVDVGFDKGFEFLSKYDDGSDDNKKQPEDDEEVGERKSSSSNRSGPYYLGPNQTNNSSFDAIPSVHLSKEDLGLKDIPIASFKENIRKPKSRRQTQHVTVLKDEDLPPGATASSDEDKESNESNPFASINFNEPLRPEEQLPVRTHRLAVGGSPAKAEQKPEKKHRKHRSSSGKEGKERKHRSSSKSEKKTTEGQLIDFDPISSLAPVQTSRGEFQEVGSPTVDSGLEPAVEKQRKSKRSSSSTSKVASRDSKDSKSRKARKEKPVVSAPVPTPAATGKPQPKFKPLCQDENLSIIYELRVNPKQSKKIMSAFAFKNLSHGEISNIEFSVPGTLNTRIAPESQAKSTIVLQAGETNNHNIIFDIMGFQQPQKIIGSISYQVGSTTAKKDFQLLLPVSAFIVPVKLTKEEFVSVLTQGGPFAMSSAQLKPDEDFRSFIVALATLLHVELIIMESSASLFGKSIQGHNIAVYAKPLGNSNVSVDIKCNDGAIGASLASELNNFFPRS